MGETTQYLKINGTNIITYSKNISGNSNSNTYLFARRDTTINPAKMKLYGCKIYVGDTLVRDFVPYYDYTTSKACLYDNVTQAIFNNAGTGDFIYN